MKLPIFARASTLEKIEQAIQKKILKYPCYIYCEENEFYGFIEKDETISWFKGNNKDLVFIGSEFPDVGDPDVFYIIDKVPYVYDPEGSFVSLLAETNAKISILQENVGALNEVVDNISETLVTVQANVSDLQTGQESLEARQTQVETDLDTLQGTVTELGSSVDGLGNRVTAVEGDVSSLQGNVSGLNTSVSEIQSSVTGLETRMGSAEGAITTLNEEQDAQDALIAAKANSADVYTKTEVDDMIGDIGGGGMTIQEYVEQVQAQTENDMKDYVDEQIGIIRV